MYMYACEKCTRLNCTQWNYIVHYVELYSILRQKEAPLEALTARDSDLVGR